MLNFHLLEKYRTGFVFLIAASGVLFTNGGKAKVVNPESSSAGRKRSISSARRLFPPLSEMKCSGAEAMALIVF